LNVKARAEAVGTFRHVNVFLMETLAAWVPSAPEMEVKVLFGRHIWLVAQVADNLGRRARELRAPLHFSRLPSASYIRALDALAALTQTAARLEGLYQAALPSLRSGYMRYLAQTDRLIDEPTVVIVEDAMREIDRMQGESVRLLEEFPALREGASSALVDLRRTFGEATDVVDVQREPQSA
jgi:hypothetical protein